MSLMSVCGTDCSACYCYGEMCSGCSACEGKVFHAPRFTTVSSMKISSRTAASAIKCHVTFGVQQEIRNIPMRNLSRISP